MSQADDTTRIRLFHVHKGVKLQKINCLPSLLWACLTQQQIEFAVSREMQSARIQTNKSNGKILITLSKMSEDPFARFRGCLRSSSGRRRQTTYNLKTSHVLTQFEETLYFSNSALHYCNISDIEYTL